MCADVLFDGLSYGKRCRRARKMERKEDERNNFSCYTTSNRHILVVSVASHAAVNASLWPLHKHFIPLASLADLLFVLAHAFLITFFLLCFHSFSSVGSFLSATDGFCSFFVANKTYNVMQKCNQRNGFQRGRPSWCVH